MRFRPRLWLATATLLLLGAVSASVAQVATGRVRGQVLDGSDAVVPGVTVEAVVSARVVATTVTDEKGQFQLPAVPPVLSRSRCARRLRNVHPGFRVQPGLETWVSGLLRVGSLSETVL